MTTPKKPSRLMAAIYASLAIALLYLVVGIATSTFLYTPVDTHLQGYIESNELLAAVIVTLGVPIIASVPLYYVLRKQHIGQRSESMTAISLTLGCLISTLIYELLVKPVFFDTATGSLMAIALLTANGALIAFIIATLSAHIAKKIYSKNRSIIVD